jgi:hypothetical protein
MYDELTCNARVPAYGCKSFEVSTGTPADAATTVLDEESTQVKFGSQTYPSSSGSGSLGAGILFSMA